MSAGPWQQARLVSFDRQTRLEARVQTPDRYRQLEALPEDCVRIARGAGVSYVAASFDREAVSQSMLGFDRLLEFDPGSGVLRVEAGASIAAVQRFALAHGRYLAVSPGHPRATVGGCIAANVHGKNPARDGCFASVTGGLHLFHPRLGWRRAERGDPLWRASLGGFGLTGSIVSAELQLAEAPVRLRIVPHAVGTLAEAADVLCEHGGAEVLYGWLDGRPARFGEGLIFTGVPAAGSGPLSMPRVRLPARCRALPVRLWNRASLAAANLLLSWRWHGQREQGLGDALLPLNGAAGYFAAYGPRGLLECQWLLPHSAFNAFAGELNRQVRRQRPLLPLISAKLFDGDSDGPAFDGRGIALALHLPADRSGHAFAVLLADLALEHGGRPNPIKQSGLSAARAARAWPKLGDWQARLAPHNPGRLIASELLRRLDLAG